MKIVFFGSDDFAQVHLQALIDYGMEIVACVTQPDRPKGRGMKLVESPIKYMAREYGYPVFQPDDIRDEVFAYKLAQLNADLFIVIAYGRILPEKLLRVPGVCALNVHGSLLPRYRGAAPINWAVINGDVTTGLTIIKMNSGMDAGDIVSRMEIPILPEDTAHDVRERMKQRGPAFLAETVEEIEEEGLENFGAYPQDESLVTRAPKLTKEMGAIDWSDSAVRIERLIRGLQPWPGAYTFYQGRRLRFLKAEIVPETDSSKPGTVTQVGKDSFDIATGEGILRVRGLQPEGSRLMSAGDFLRGYPLSVNLRLPDYP